MKSWFKEHPLAASVIIWIADIVFVLAGAWLLSLLFPSMPGYGRGLSQSLVLVLVGVVLVAAMLTAFRWWRLAGFVGPAQWRDLRVLWLPVVILLLPFVQGVRPLPPSEFLTLVVAYAATAFFEEAIYRGAMLGLLRPRGIWTAVIISSLLFGLVHFSNIVLRGSPGLIALQALGAATGGVGMAAIRLRTRTIWPVIGLHAAHDLFLQLSYLPIPLVDAANSIILFCYAFYLLRPSMRARLEAAPEDAALHGAAMREATVPWWLEKRRYKEQGRRSGCPAGAASATTSTAHRTARLFLSSTATRARAWTCSMPGARRWTACPCA